MTFLDLMEKEILRAGRPISISEALSFAKEDGTLEQFQKIGLTPQKTINSLLHKDMAKGEKAKFVQASTRPATFDLKNR